MSQTIAIDITQRDIDQARRFTNNWRCPIELALDRALPDRANMYWVNSSEISVRSTGPSVPASPQQNEFVRNFDNGKDVEPTRMIVQVPDVN